MSVTTTSTGPLASSSCSTADFTRFPSADISCAVGSIQALPSNTTSIMSQCCKSAPVEAFNGNCGHYCLSVQQTVADLQKCFMQAGVSPSNIFCNGQQTQSATGTPSRTAGGASATGAAAASGSAGAAAGVVVQGVGKTGMGVLAMVVVSVLAGAML